ncbi:unnamed protein product [Prorocentrum cordatum]|uniref:Uncharacterized protein n=1 Tax=Prorocentrum cordatum TaxID=2364126 RepID=A0ABN9RK28_9DINO|nr:unnamed protein product [Polarella glacialis]
MDVEVAGVVRDAEGVCFGEAGGSSVEVSPELHTRGEFEQEVDRSFSRRVRDDLIDIEVVGIVRDAEGVGVGEAGDSSVEDSSELHAREEYEQDDADGELASGSFGPQSEAEADAKPSGLVFGILEGLDLSMVHYVDACYELPSGAISVHLEVMGVARSPWTGGGAQAFARGYVEGNRTRSFDSGGGCATATRTRERRAEKLGEDACADVEAGSSGPGLPRRVGAGAEPGPGAVAAPSSSQASGVGLILPPLASVARARGFASVEAARARGREARAERAAAARGEGGPQEDEPVP